MNQRQKKNIDYIDRYLSKYVQIQLWVFVSCMVLIAIIYIANPSAYTYEVVSADNESMQLWIEGSNITEGLEELNSITFEKISSVRAEELEKKYNRLAWLTFICIIGMFVSQKEKRERIKELYKKVKRKIK